MKAEIGAAAVCVINRYYNKVSHKRNWEAELGLLIKEWWVSKHKRECNGCKNMVDVIHSLSNEPEWEGLLSFTFVYVANNYNRVQPSSNQPYKRMFQLHATFQTFFWSPSMQNWIYCSSPQFYWSKLCELLKRTKLWLIISCRNSLLSTIWWITMKPNILQKQYPLFEGISVLWYIMKIGIS